MKLRISSHDRYLRQGRSHYVKQEIPHRRQEMKEEEGPGKVLTLSAPDHTDEIRSRELACFDRGQHRRNG